MSRMQTWMAAGALAAGLLVVPAAHAAESDTMACTVSVNYTLNNASRMTYDREFLVSEASPFTDDFSNSLRFRFFDATMTVVDNVPVVTIALDADVSTFNSVGFTASLTVKDERHGETLNGQSAFFSSAPGAAGAHRTTYTLTCRRADQ